jgi:hypothetical protein
MAKNRVIYQSEGLYAGPSPATGAHPDASINQLQRVQNANYSFNIDRQDVNQYGELAAIDRIILTAPTVSLDFQYLLANLINEKRLGFTISDSTSNYVSAISGILNKTQDERNYFIRTVGEGIDAKGVLSGAANQNTIGIGNGFITSYTTEASVGNFPTASVTVEALNMKVDSAVGGSIPAVNPVDGTAINSITYKLPTFSGNAGNDTVSVLRPGDITFSLVKNSDTALPSEYFGTSISDAKIQSYSLGFDLSRTPLEKLGSKFAFSREIDFPVEVTFSIDASVGDLTTGNLADMINTDSNYDLTVDLKHPTTAVPHTRYHIKKAKLVNQEFSSSIGDNKSVSLSWSAQIGGPNQTDVGLFLSGVSS